jgi:hypothetical protein
MGFATKETAIPGLGQLQRIANCEFGSKAAFAEADVRKIVRTTQFLGKLNATQKVSLNRPYRAKPSSISGYCRESKANHPRRVG